MDILTFKERVDLTIWRANAGPRWVRDRITRANVLCLKKFNKSAVVTAWYKDSPFHNVLEAFDLRVNDLVVTAQQQYRTMLCDDGIPAMLIDEGTDNAHIHVGDLATQKYEREYR